MIVINRKLCKNQNYDGKIHTHRIKWNKVDLNEYEKLVEGHIAGIFKLSSIKNF
jgi:hypothetical protein